MSDKGVLAAALSGGVAGGMGAIRKTNELTEKMAWGDEIARQKRQENLARWGQEEKVAATQQGYDIDKLNLGSTLRKGEFSYSLNATELRKRQNVADEMVAKYSAYGATDSQIKQISGLAMAGLDAATLEGTSGKPLTANQANELASAIEKLMPDASDEDRLNTFKKIEATLTTGSPSLSTRVEGAKTDKEQAKALEVFNTKVNMGKQKVASGLTSDEAGTITELRKIAASDLPLANSIIDGLEADGTINKSKSQYLKKQLAAKNQPVLPVAVTQERGRPMAEAFPNDTGVLAPPSQQPTSVTGTRTF
jgi:hypothetical protein